MKSGRHISYFRDKHVNTNLKTSLNMKKLLTLCAVTVLSVASTHAASVVLYDGDSVSNPGGYTTSDQNFNSSGINGFLDGGSNLIAPSANYTGPTVYGGTEVQVTTLSPSLYRLDNDNGNTSGSDVLYWQAAGGTSGEVIYGTFFFDSSDPFLVESDSVIRLNARRTGGREASGTGITAGLRWTLRDATTGDYYISELDDSVAARYSGAYQTNWGSSTVTDNSPELLNWFNYDPSTSGVGAIGTAASIDFANTSFDQGGFMYTNTRDVGGFLIMEFAQFEIQGTVVPEPTSTALLFGAAGLLAFRSRGRRS